MINFLKVTLGVSSFFTFTFLYILANKMTYSFVANRIPESPIIALLIRILH